jgi:hypothetical protein
MTTIEPIARAGFQTPIIPHHSGGSRSSKKGFPDTHQLGVFASGKLEKGGSDSNTETFYRDPAG